MKMNRKLFLPLLTLSAILIFSENTFSQGTIISITTSSDEAKETFIIGRQKKENIQLDAAEILFDRALELDPQFALAYLYRGKPGDFDKALEFIDSIAEGEKLTILYFVAFERYEYKLAKDYLDELLQHFPSCKHVHLWAGLFYENILQNYQLALDHFYIASRLDEYYAAPHNEIGYRLMRLGNFKDAELAFRRYIALAPDCPNAFDSYANFLMKQKRYDESIRQYTEVYDLNPDKIITIARIGQNYAFRKEYEEARSYYQKYYDMAENTGQKAIALNLSAGSFIAEGKIKRAIDKMQEYIKLGDKSGSNIDIVSGTANVALINLEMGNPKKGLEEYHKAEELLNSLTLPESTRRRYTYSALGWLCRAYAANKDYEEADSYLKKAKMIVDETMNPLYMSEYNLFKGYIELEKGNFDSAIENLLLCSQDDPFNIYTLAKAYSQAGEFENAQELIELLESWENFSLEYAISLVKAGDIVIED
jgi:tetratricopeptide (TPR) repeat protein